MSSPLGTSLGSGQSPFPPPAPQGSVFLPVLTAFLPMSSAGSEPPGAWNLPSLRQQNKASCPAFLQPRGGRKGPLSSPSSFKGCLLPGAAAPELDGSRVSVRLWPGGGGLDSNSPSSCRSWLKMPPSRCVLAALSVLPQRTAHIHVFGSFQGS